MSGQTCATGCMCKRHSCKPRIIPTCHPERKHSGLGLCYQCYHAEYNAANKAEIHAKRHGTTDMAGVRWALRMPACIICGRKTNFHIDHDHKTGKVRGRLCGQCNKGLGLFGESTTRLMKAVRYLNAEI